MTGPVLILVGPPGSGKSTVGRAVAAQLGVDFRDLDDDVRDAHGLEAGDLVVELGRERFQEVEVELLRTVLATYDGVLALGGGTPTAPGAAELLSGSSVVFLDVDLDNLLRREGLLPLHPWLLPNPRAHLRQLLTERRPVYEAVSQTTVPTSGRPVRDVVDDVLQSLAGAAS
ncbi:MAG TPA: shikimate kinase [Pseudonocardia sp.]